jgi:biopolymer transport protein ExbD/biopolymer transport protein TolR
MAFTAHDGRTRTTLAEINMVPFIDIVLVLLIIFMVTVPVIQSGVEVHVPKTEFVREIVEERLVVSLTADEKLYLQNDPVNIHDLVQKIREKNPKTTGQSIYVRADADAHVGTLLQIMDTLKVGGIDNVSMVTEPLDSKVDGKSKGNAP